MTQQTCGSGGSGGNKTMTCNHQYTYGGVRYYDGIRSMPGGSAFRRYYAHVYYCVKCTECKGHPIMSVGNNPTWNSYSKVQFNATPGTAVLCGVPLDDQQ